MCCSVHADGSQQHVRLQGHGESVLRPHEVHPHQARLPLQVIWLPGQYMLSTLSPLSFTYLGGSKPSTHCDLEDLLYWRTEWKRW